MSIELFTLIDETFFNFLIQTKSLKKLKRTSTTIMISRMMKKEMKMIIPDQKMTINRSTMLMRRRGRTNLKIQL